MRIRSGSVVALAAAALLASPASAALDHNAALNPGQQIVFKGHLEGASPHGVAPLPYRTDVPEVCTPQACSDAKVRLKLPKGKRQGVLSGSVMSQATNLGFQVRVFDSKGVLVGSSGGGGIGAGAAPGTVVQSAFEVRRMPAGVYTVRVYLSAGTADYTETLKWR